MAVACGVGVINNGNGGVAITTIANNNGLYVQQQWLIIVSQYGKMAVACSLTAGWLQRNKYNCVI